ncbi:MAG TPA: 2-dehydropantoate 2-reductase [Chloroflexota bacterium]|nr:2-dehydropantoate 2-reductase [Chloroflexota bacterium]
MTSCAIVGAGAIGGLLGGYLARSGQQVTLIARGPHLAAMREHGLRVLTSDGGEFLTHPACTDDLAAIREADVVFLTLKAHTLIDMAPAIGPLLAPQAAVVSAVNGIPWWYFEGRGDELDGRHLQTVDPGGSVAKAIGKERGVGCVVYPAAELVAPGVVRHVEGNRFSLGEIDGPISDRCRTIAAALNQSGLKAPIRSNLRDELWVKLVGNAVFNPMSALTRAELDVMCTHPATRPVIYAAMQEVASVAKALDLDLPIGVDQRLAAAEKIPHHKTSMLQDIEAGRRLEVDPICGAVVEIADLVNVPVPHLRTIYGAAKLLDQTLHPG